MPAEKPPENSQKNKLGILAALSYVVARIIGTGIFITPTTILKNTGSVGFSLIIWGICGLLSILGALCYIELGTSIRQSGSDFAYQTYVGWHPVAFALSLTQGIIHILLLLRYASSAGVLMQTIGTYVLAAISHVLCVPEWGQVFVSKAIGLLLLYFFVWMNFSAIDKYAAKLQVASLFAKLGALAIISITGIYYLISGKATAAFSNPMGGTTVTSEGLVNALYAGFWAYAGWDSINYGIEDVKNPQKALPIAAVGGSLIVGGAYVLTNVAYFAVLGVDGMLQSDAVVVTFCERAFGPIVANIVPAVVGLMAATTLNVNLFICSRLIFAAARRRHFPTFLSCLEEESGSPKPAIIIFSIFATLMLLIGNLSTLIGYVNFVDWLQHLVSIGALIWIRFRKIPVDNQALRLPIVMHIVFFLVCLYLVVVPSYQSPKVGGVGFGVVAIGILLYFLVVWNKRLPRVFYKLNGKFAYIVDHVEETLLKWTQMLFVVTPQLMTEESKEGKNKIQPTDTPPVLPSAPPMEIDGTEATVNRRNVQKF